MPELLTESLKAVEDRRFDTHFGIDARAMVRAALANVRAGGISQGGSTLTMQLVRSYFLNNRQTYTRKIREALMSLVLELRHSKDEIMLAYVNEIYLGQDGGRAVHGFGLASRFYFGKPLTELDVHEIALLVAIVRGPSYYDPRRNPERALARRTLVLEQMRERGLIDERAYATNKDRELGVVTAEPAHDVLRLVHGPRPSSARGATTRKRSSRNAGSRSTRRSILRFKPAPRKPSSMSSRACRATARSSKARSSSRARTTPKCERSSAASGSASTASTGRSTRSGKSDR